MDIQSYLKQLLPDDTLRTYLLYMLGSIYFGENTTKKPVIVIRGPGKNGVSMFLHILWYAFLDHTISLETRFHGFDFANLVYRYGKDSKKLRLLIHNSETTVSKNTSIDGLIIRNLPISCILSSNIYPSFTYNFELLWNEIFIFPFTSYFVEKQYANPSQHKYERYERLSVHLKQLASDLKKIIHETYNLYKDSPLPTPLFIVEEREGCKNFNKLYDYN